MEVCFDFKFGTYLSNDQVTRKVLTPLSFILLSNNFLFVSVDHGQLELYSFQKSEFLLK